MEVLCQVWLQWLIGVIECVTVLVGPVDFVKELVKLGMSESAAHLLQWD